ncbi:MAG: serine/threonine protein kinase [Anaerolineae bacterium]|nr:serine/threonine protein kinase [Anaerolineae bacterium]
MNDASTAKIESPTWRWLGRALYGALLIASVIFIGQMTFAALTYHRALAAEELAGSGWADLYVWGQVLVRLVVHVFFLFIGVLIFWRRSHDRFALLVSLALVTFGAGGPAFYLAIPNLTTFLVEKGLAWGYYLLSPLGWSLFAFTAITFPDGRIVPRWMRYVSVIVLLEVLAWAMPSDSPLYPFSWSPWVIAVVTVPVWLVLFYGYYYRFRYISTPTQRQQIKWFMVLFIAYMVMYMSAFIIRALFPETFPLGGVSYHVVFLIGSASAVAIPIGLLISIMRYRLWDIDLVINRSLVYGTAGTVALLAFAILLVGLQSLTGQSQPLLVVLFSTLVSAALFMPLRNRSQHLIDRNLYRLRYDLNELNRIQRGVVIKNPGTLSGRKLGTYVVQDLIGKGGMGEVYRAEGNGEIVAIKTLLSEATPNDEMLQRFQREAQTGMTLHHSNIARVRAIDSQDGLIYMVMDYLDGQDLGHFLKSKSSLSADKVVEIVTKLGEALTAVHDAGLVHRDIKPSNVMLVSEGEHETGRVVLMDFGVTKIQGAKTLTRAETVGTIEYMAPEQIVNAREVDHRADIYSVGIMMYEMVIGERPFTGNVGQVVFAQIQQPAPDPRKANKDVPRPLAKAIMKALEKNPDDRFRSMAELVHALQNEPEKDVLEGMADLLIMRTPSNLRPTGGTSAI